MSDVGTLLADKYRLSRCIGAGGMGGVFEAVNEQIGKPVAVKLLRPEFAFDGEMVVRFMREARAAAAIGHPNIVDIYDVGAAPDGALFMVMELLKGETLGHVLARHKILDVATAAYGECQVLSALEAAHKQDVVHRDIKPGNIFLVDTGQALPDVKLLDFGIAKALDPNRPGERLTKTGTPVGTPSFMSPEQVLGEKDVDLRADVYGMGVLLYRCLTGVLPFKGDEHEGVYYKIMKGHFPPPRKLRPELPPPVEQVVLRAMSMKREERYQSAAEMFAALMVFLDERAVDRLVLPAGMARRSYVPSAASGSPPSGPFQLASSTPGGAVSSGQYPAVASGQFPAVTSGAYPAATAGSASGGRRGLALPIAIVVGVLALVAMGVAFAWLRPWSRGDAETPTATVRADTEPATPAVPPPPTEPAKLPTPAAPTPALVPATPAAQPSVEIRVQVDPTVARVLIDGVAQGMSPFVGRFPRDDVEHHIVAQAEGYEDREVGVRSPPPERLIRSPSSGPAGHRAPTGHSGAHPLLEHPPERRVGSRRPAGPGHEPLRSVAS